MTPNQMAAIHKIAMDTSRPWSEREMAQMLAHDGVFTIADPAGFALGRAIGAEAELLTIAVDPQAQRQGIGRALLNRFEEESLRRHATDLFLEVAEDNIAAQALYRKAGWSEAGRRSNYYPRAEGFSVDALLLKKTLQSA